MCRKRSTPTWRATSHITLVPSQLVCTNSSGRRDRAVDVALGGEVHDGVVAVHRGEHGVAVGDVALHERVAGVVVEVAQVVEVAGVGERVEDRDRVVGASRARSARSSTR